MASRIDTPDLEEEPAPALLELVGSIAVPTGQVLVLHCGAGHDVFSMAAPGSLVTGIDPRPEMATRFEAMRVEHGLPPSFVRLLTADPFTWAADRSFDLVWDAAFLGRVAPADRPRWAARVADLVKAGGELWVLLYPTSATTALPVVDPLEVDALLTTSFDRLALGPVARSRPDRQGLEWLGRWRRR